MAETNSGQTSGLYDFDAPSHVDFKELLDAEFDDHWFDKHADGACPQLVTPARPDQQLMEADHSGAHGDEVEKDVKSGQSQAKCTSSNMISSEEAKKSGQAKREPVKERHAQPRRISKRKEMSCSAAAPPVKKSKGLSSSEELELERIRSLQREVALHRRKNEASYKAALAGDPPPKKMLTSATVPKDFHFNTESRIKAPASSNASQKEVNFINQLRQPCSPAKARKGATVPKPFNLSAGHKNCKDGPGVYVSMAQLVEQFQKRTPTRYHLRSRRTQERGPSPLKGQHLHLTQPHSPQLMTRQRSRQPSVKSSAELEAEELEKLQKFKIKTVELNKKILEGPEELRKPAAKEPTVPEGFELEIEKRLQERQLNKKSQDREEPHNFKANPLPKKVLDGIVGLPEKKVTYPTVPESPAFVLKKRVRIERKVEEVKPPSPVKAISVPYFGVPFQPQLSESHQVEVCPFSFEQRDKERQALKEKKLAELQNEEVPHFKAQPLPDFNAVVLPEKKKPEPTKPEPFRLQIDERGAGRLRQWEQMVKEEQKQQEEAATFKAKPNTVTQKEPFRPKKENRTSVDIDPSAAVEPFQLATERRAQEWQEYERLIGEKEVLRARMEAEQRLEEEQREREEIARLRQEQVHKAQPIRHYKPVAVKKSDAPLTVPESPNFSKRFR
ncbi:targeting protein for Xklp2 isoform X1 [Xiphophorus couchianus]|uniref:targeting protein for Xklp2 isoform X1 n=1 Tax=Xiphophorus couchianus TaxID=32473 RepID=UPI0010166CF9|nr:targeting protein for Xklp2 isoform X1 [Xiphophorus couchianus]XP_027868685.1 targeting protein for Xklp2 isoform X1 [Xiphophorus couchianus]XP_027868695.1 targeting protein for Xklp2 isoform X1 [Xiphophorus couchianus]XP_027868704.1 targeting protein for Xklp2 isoform X1 [Xiphophorus couchianus]